MQLPTLTVNYNGVAVEVSTRTPRLEMYRRQIINAVTEFNKEIALSLGVAEGVSNVDLLDFAEYSVICNVVSGELDFEFAQPTDDAQTVRQKFEVYIDTAFYPLFSQVDVAINQLHKPSDPVTSSNPPPLDEKKSKKE